MNLRCLMLNRGLVWLVALKGNLELMEEVELVLNEQLEWIDPFLLTYSIGKWRERGKERQVPTTQRDGFLIVTNHSHFYSSTERHYRHSLDSSRLGLSAVSLSSLRNSN